MGVLSSKLLIGSLSKFKPFKNKKLYGSETITYYNNSPEDLEYLWVQLEQNIERPDSKTPLVESQNMDKAISTSGFAKKYMGSPFQGGFNIEYVKGAKGNPMKYTINQTMMRIDLPKPLKNGEKVSFSIKWWYNIVNYMEGANNGTTFIDEKVHTITPVSNAVTSSNQKKFGDI